MVFKLIRVDIEEPSKLQLQVGKHIIGRGKFLHNDDSDKRVSRNHAELEVTDDSITLKALHQNPCFYIKSSTVDTEILQQNDTISLNNGDKFGLIPDNFWYEVVHCSNLVNSDSTACINKDSKVENGNEINETEKESVEQNDVTSDIGDTDEAINFHMSKQEVMNRSASPSLLNREDSSTEGYAVDNQASDTEPSTPNKRPHDSDDSSPVNLKKVKTEPPTQDVQDPHPGPSNDQVAHDDNTDQKPNIGAPGSPPQLPAPAPKRERCIYGANCYRRNPAHKAQFAHPADLDWGAGERGECPFGRACRKREPRHWQAHAHPPGVAPPAHAHRPAGQRTNPNHHNGGTSRSKRKAKRNVRSSASEDDCYDTPETDLIVTGKRTRKTVKRDAWIDTQSDEEDPYGTDESDDWQPSSDMTNSGGFSQNF